MKRAIAYATLLAPIFLLPNLAIAKNPFENSVYIPIKFNSYYGPGPKKEAYHLLTTQPIWSTPLTNDWNVIWRGGIKAVSKWVKGADEERVWGLGDSFISTFFSPENSGAMTWGVGPSLLLPTASDEKLGQEKYAIGPSAVFFLSGKKGHVGAFIRNVWSFAGNEERKEINAFLFQPLLKYRVNDKWALTSSPAITANWEAPSENRWKIPVGGGISRTFTINQKRADFNIQLYYMAERPDNAAEWMSQAVFSFSLPR